MEVGYHRVQVRQSVRPEFDPHGPADLVFLEHGAENQMLSCLVAAVLAAQMWCPVAVSHFCSAVHRRPQEAKTAKGLMNIFLDTVRHISDVAKEEKHIDHKEWEDIWA